VRGDISAGIFAHFSASCTLIFIFAFLLHIPPFRRYNIFIAANHTQQYSKEPTNILVALVTKFWDYCIATNDFWLLFRSENMAPRIWRQGSKIDYDIYYISFPKVCEIYCIMTLIHFVLRPWQPWRRLHAHDADSFSSFSDRGSRDDDFTHMTLFRLL